jgi:hypothetical protein
MRTRYTVIREIYDAFEERREVWVLESGYTRNDDILIGPRAEVEALIRSRHGFSDIPSDWELVLIPDIETFRAWFTIFE